MKLKISNFKYEIILVLFIISLISSIILSIPSVSDMCSVVGGCDIVHDCCYNYTFGILNSYFGILAFLFLSIITFFQIKKPSKIKRNTIHLGTILGSIFALWFIYLQQFVIGAYCQYCLVVDFSLLIALGIIIFNWRDKK
ncbi:MAG: vitamin K epoxide reductase family protein [Candidatus Pacearchaeota archaeon]